MQEENKEEIYEEAYEVYKECFPAIPMTKDIFLELCRKEPNRIIHNTSGGRAAGFAIVSKNILRLICVRPDMQGKNFGHMLVMMSEGAAAGTGSHEMIVGGDDSPFFMIGAADSTKKFFEAHEFTFDETPCYEMKLDLSGFENRLAAPEGIRFDYYKGDIEKLRKAIAAVDDAWVRFFDSTENVYAAFDGDEIAAFCSIDTNDTNLLSGENIRTGSIGCVGTLPSYRKKGIGLAMVAAAADICKGAGCDNVFIHYTYLDKWYGKLGAEPVLKMWKGKKFLPEWKISGKEQPQI